jgi:hypothetical protein
LHVGRNEAIARPPRDFRDSYVGVKAHRATRRRYLATCRKETTRSDSFVSARSPAVPS